MASPSTCANCGAPLAGEARKGFCPKCLFAQAQSGLFDFNLEGDFGDYELLEEIGRGGMGVVYRARQRSLDREVAIKRMVFGPGSDPDLVKRFRAEAVSAAALRHPNIVAIHEVGVNEGQHFFVMDYVQGQSLAHLVTAGPLPARRAAGYLKTLAEAVHYAHECGILHRDLKPTNVLIDEQDQPRIVDFGLARRLEGASELTVTGQVLGSPHYLPPEQATAQRGRVTRRTDVYGLGATLYHLLTGRPPFQAESLAQTLDSVLHTEPVAPHLLNPTVPRDLETICLKCLEKESGKRYPTAQHVAEELGRFLEGKPILARPVGPVSKVWRWCRRNPVTAAALGATLLSLVIGLAGVSWAWRQAEAQRQRAEVGEATARRQAYISDINAAQAALKDNNPARALELLNRQRPPAKSAIRNPKSEMDLRGFEWPYLWQQCQTDAEAFIGQLSSRIISLDVSRNGRWLLAGCEGGAVKLWNLATREEIELTPDRGWPNYGTFSPDSRLVVFSEEAPTAHGTLAIWDLEARKRLAPILGDGRPVGCPAFSTDGHWLGLGVVIPHAAVGGDSARGLRVIEFATCMQVTELFSRTPMVDLRKGLVWVFVPGTQSVIGEEIEPDCQFILTDFAAGMPSQYFPAHREGITALAISPDGRLLASGAGYTDNVVRLWDVPSFRPAGELATHGAWITSLKFSPDGQTLASASADQTIRLWHVSQRTPGRVYLRLGGEPTCLCFSPGGRTLFSGMGDGGIFRCSAGNEPLTRDRHLEHVQTGLAAVALTGDGAQFAGLQQGTVLLGRLPDGLGTPLPELGTNNNVLRFSAERRFLFSGTKPGEVLVWSLAHHRVQARLKGPPEAHWFGQDAPGRLLVAVAWSLGHVFQTFPPGPHTVSVWSTGDWRRERLFSIPGLGAHYAVSPDGDRLAAAFMLGNLQVWSLSDPSVTNTLDFPGNLSAVAFSPDSKLLAAATVEGAVRVWALPAFREAGRFRARSGQLFGLAFAPDGRRLASVGMRGAALDLWDVGTWQKLITLESPQEISQAAFSPEGNQLTGVSGEGDVLLWRVPSFAEIEMKERTQKHR